MPTVLITAWEYETWGGNPTEKNPTTTNQTPNPDLARCNVDTGTDLLLVVLKEGVLHWGFRGDECNTLCQVVCSEGRQDNSGFSLSCQLLRGCALSCSKIPSACRADITSDHIPFNLTVHLCPYQTCRLSKKLFISAGVMNQSGEIQMKKLIQGIISPNNRKFQICRILQLLGKMGSSCAVQFGT